MKPACLGRFLCSFRQQGGSVYVSISPGTSPLIITVPHDGGNVIPGVEIRSQVREWRSKYGEMDCRDFGTLSIARTISQINNGYRAKPTLIAVHVHRSQLDVNRGRAREPFVSGHLENAYNEFYQVLYESIERILALHGRGLLLDLHGYFYSPGPDEYDVILGTDKHQTCPSGSDWQLQAALLSHSFRTVFSPDRNAGIKRQYRGGWIVRKSARDWNRHGLETCQVEIADHIRRRDANCSAAGQRLATCLAAAAQGVLFLQQTG